MYKIKRWFIRVFILIFLITIIPAIQSNTYPVNAAINSSHIYRPLAGTDDLGRTLPDYTTVGQPKSNRTVGMFYVLWHGASDGKDYKNIFNNDEILANNPNAPLYTDSSVWPSNGHNAYWNKPLFGYYRSDDEWIIRKHMQMLADAGIDYLILDASNFEIYKAQAALVMRTIEELQRQGVKAPQVAFITHSNSTAMMDEIYNTFYADHAPYRYPSTWFYWKGKPLIVGVSPSQTVSNFFTVRYAQWPNEPKQANNGWDWISFEYPQRVNYNSSGEKEQIAVSVAQNCGSSAVFSYTAWYNMDNPPSRSRNYHNGSEDTTTGAVNYGYNFQQQWDNAIAQDPQTILICEWNEWTAVKCGDPPTPITFFDNCETRWSRDIEPMTSGFGDNYYMQLISNIRRYKGVEAPATPTQSKTITINSDYSQWSDVGPNYKDYTGDTMIRDHAGTDNKIYTDTTGRNDFDIMKVARDASKLYFYASTSSNITSYTDSHWMTLYLDVDGNGTNGWKGYDYVINRTSPGSAACTLERSTGGWNWQTVSTTISYNKTGNQIMLAIPRSSLGSLSDPLNIQFKWVDNWQNNDSITDFYKHGDAAPDGRLKYVYKTSTLPARVEAAYPQVNPGTAIRQPDGMYKIEDNDYKSEYQAHLGDTLSNWTTANDSGCSGGQYHYFSTSQASSTSQFRSFVRAGFKGNNIRWITTKASNAIDAEVFIDGVSQGVVSLYNATAQKQAVVFEKFGLPYGEHEIMVQWLEQNGTYYHDCFEYGVGNTTIPSPVVGENMALKAYTTQSSFETARWFGTNGARVNDNSNSSYWRAATSSGEWVALDFGRKMTFDKVEFVQNTSNSRISSYKIQCWNGSAWYDVYTGSTMADNQIDTFPTVTSGKVRLLVNSTTQNTPSIYEMKVFSTTSNWEFTSSMEGWGQTGTFGINNLAWQTGGTIGGDVWYGDAQFFSPDSLGIHITNKTRIKVSMRNQTASTTGNLFFITNTDTTYNAAKSKAIPLIANDTGLREYILDMSTVPGWTGTLKQIRFDPEEGVTSGSFKIDYIRIELPISSTGAVNVTTQAGSAPVLPASVSATLAGGASMEVGVMWNSISPAQYASPGSFTVNGILVGSSYQITANVTVEAKRYWEFATDMEGWGQTGTFGINNLVWQSGGYIGGDVWYGDAQFFSLDNLGINLSNYKKIRIRMWNRTASTTGNIFFITTTNTTYDANKSKGIQLVASDAGFREYILDMSTVSGWTGTLKQIRFDPEEGVTSGSFKIDYVRLEPAN